jgi:tungstate transport system ATP-binding protein
MTIILVTHHIFQARRLAHRVGLLYDNRLIEVAETERFFTSPQDPCTRAFTAGTLIY